MKRRNISPLLALALGLLLLGPGCATSSVSLQVLVPAHISVPSDVQNLALINRYRPGKGEGLLNVLEGALSGENIGQDRRAAESALTGLTDALAGSPRFRITRPGEELKGTGRADFPPPVEPGIVKSICFSYKADALVTIEAFDSDTRVACAAEVRERKQDGKVVKYTVFAAVKTIGVTVGWRMYNGNSGVLLDEYRMFESIRFTAEGNTERQALANLPNREAITRRIGDVTGRKYSERISPTWLWVSRQYYSKGSDELKSGKRQVKWNDYEQAEAWWDKALDDPDPKVQGRAMFNKALAAELRGDLPTALQLATDAGKRFGNKKAFEYSKIIRQRLTEQEILDEQMKGAPEE